MTVLPSRDNALKATLLPAPTPRSASREVAANRRCQPRSRTSVLPKKADPDGRAKSLSKDAASEVSVKSARERLSGRTSQASETSERPFAVEDVLERDDVQAFMAALILLNAVVIGLETDIPHALPWESVENAFLAVFLMELVLKIYSQGVLRYFAVSNQDIIWNLFDCVVVGLGLADTLMVLCVNQSSGSFATLFRIIRLMRIVRLFRLVKFLKQLYLLVYGFIEAVQAIFWVTLLMLVVLYVCSIVMVRTEGRLLEDVPHAEFLSEQFANIRTSMVTLFVLMSSPNLPKYIREDGLVWERPMLLVFLITFTILGSFGMIALLTGVISESMFEKNHIRNDEVRKEQDEMMVQFDQKACDIFSTLEVDVYGKATPEEILTRAMPPISNMFEEAMIEYSVANLQKLVTLMNPEGEGTISLDEFKNAVKNYAQGVKPLVLQEVQCQVSKSLAATYEFAGALTELKEQVAAFSEVTANAPAGCCLLGSARQLAETGVQQGPSGRSGSEIDRIRGMFRQLAELPVPMGDLLRTGLDDVDCKLQQTLHLARQVGHPQGAAPPTAEAPGAELAPLSSAAVRMAPARRSSGGRWGRAASAAPARAQD